MDGSAEVKEELLIGLALGGDVVASAQSEFVGCQGGLFWRWKRRKEGEGRVAQSCRG